MKFVIKAAKAPVGTIRKRKGGEFEKKKEGYWALIKTAVNHGLEKNKIKAEDVDDDLHDTLHKQVDAVRRHLETGRKTDTFWDGLTNADDEPFSARHKKIVMDSHQHLHDLMNPKFETPEAANAAPKEMSQGKIEELQERDLVNKITNALEKTKVGFSNSPGKVRIDIANTLVKELGDEEAKKAMEYIRKRGVRDFAMTDEDLLKIQGVKYKDFVIGGKYYAPFVAMMGKHLDAFKEATGISLGDSFTIIPREKAQIKNVGGLYDSGHRILEVYFKNNYYAFAHEIGHAIDHFLNNWEATSSHKSKINKHTQKIVDAYMKTEEAENYKHEYYKKTKAFSSKRLGTKSQSEYYLTPTEIFARCFDRWSEERIPGWKEAGLTSFKYAKNPAIQDKTWNEIKDVLDEVFKSKEVKKALKFIFGGKYDFAL